MQKKYTKELLEPIVKDSYSLSEVLRILNPESKIHGGSVGWLKNKLIKFEIDFTHFTGRAWRKDRELKMSKMNKDLLIDKYLNHDSDIISDRLKGYLFKFGLLENECSICKNDGNWNDRKLVLQLDHINGNRKDNRLENLRILCPNCHTQTHTYSGKKNGK